MCARAVGKCPCLLIIPILVPSAPPQDIKAWNTSSTSLKVTWGPVPQPARNGRILKYIVRCRSSHEDESIHHTTHDPLLLVGLRKFTQYSVDVSAVTRVGAGPQSYTSASTDEDGTVSIRLVSWFIKTTLRDFRCVLYLSSGIFASRKLSMSRKVLIRSFLLRCSGLLNICVVSHVYAEMIYLSRNQVSLSVLLALSFLSI